MALRRGERRYSFQTVFPPTIVRTARPFSFQPSNGVLRDIDCEALDSNVHSSSGSISVTSADAPGRQRARLDLQQPRRIDREHLDQPRQVDRLVLVHEQIEKQSELRLESDDPKRRLIELDFLLELRVRRVIAAQNADRAVGDAPRATPRHPPSSAAADSFCSSVSKFWIDSSVSAM